jgi:hypothetical protein
MVRQLRKWSTTSRSILNEVSAYAQENEKFNTIVSMEHGQMLQQNIALRLAFYYGMEERGKAARQPTPQAHGAADIAVNLVRFSHPSFQTSQLKLAPSHS